jgi:uncharacterized protein YukE
VGSELDAFYSTWSQARQTYGEGTPATGERFDASGTLTGLRSQLDGAAPGSRWTGAAAEAYGQATTRHQQVLGTLADLDSRLSGQVTNAANIVSTGRTNLDELRKWVTDAAANTGDDEAGRTMRMQIARQGLAQLTEIMTGSHEQLQTVKGNIDKLTGEYDRVKGDVQFLNGEDSDGDGKPDDETPEEKAEREAEEEKQLAADRVREALGGDQKAAAEVDRILDGISADKLAGTTPLSPTEQQTLSQMGYQTKNLSLDQLTDLKGRLGDHGDILADSWQVLSDPDVKVPATTDFSELHPELDTPPVAGSLDHLPTSMQGPLTEAAATPSSQTPVKVPLPWEFHNQEELRQIAGLVAAGDDRFQNGTQLDRSLMDRGVETLAGSEASPTNDKTAHDDVIQDIFNSAGRDEIVNHDVITGDGGQKFLHDAAFHNWTDDGASAKFLTDWVDDAANGNDPVMDRLAGETAHSVATFVGENHDDLKNINGIFDNSVGDRNPQLIRGWAEALAPYQEAMIGDGSEPGFGPLKDQVSGDYTQARNVFEIMYTDPVAAENFSKHAYGSILDYQQQTADAAASGKPADGTAMGNAGRLLGVMNAAATAAETDNGWDIRQSALNLALGEATGKLPVIGQLGNDYLSSVLVGNPVFGSDTHIATHSFTEVENAQTWAVASQLFERNVPPTDGLAGFMSGGRLMTPEDVLQQRPADIENYYQALSDYANTSNGWGKVLNDFQREYDHGAGSRR